MERKMWYENRKYHQFDEKYNSLHFSFSLASCVVQLIEFNKIDCVMQALDKC